MEKTDSAMMDKKADMKGSAKHKALEAKLHKTHSSTTHCEKCGAMTRKSVEYSSGHNSYDHEHHG